MNIVSHSRCKKCGKSKNISELKDNDQGVGKICEDTKACEIRIRDSKIKTKKGI